MTDQNSNNQDGQNGNATDNSANNGQDNQNANAGNNGNATDKTANIIPKGRFDEINQKYKESQETLDSIAKELVADIPEDFRGLVPDLPPAQKIKWIRDAQKSGIFNPKTSDTSSPDSKRPSGGKPPQNFEGMNPYEIMKTGYKN